MGVFQSDARTAAILGGLGIVGVIGSEDKIEEQKDLFKEVRSIF